MTCSSGTGSRPTSSRRWRPRSPRASAGTAAGADEQRDRALAKGDLPAVLVVGIVADGLRSRDLAPVLRHQPRDRLARLGDDDLLTQPHAPDQRRQMQPGVVKIDCDGHDLSARIRCEPASQAVNPPRSAQTTAMSPAVRVRAPDDLLFGCERHRAW
jgi:hypothetical protein